ARFKIEEVVSLTLEFYKRNYIEGLFLSSGIVVSSDETMGQLVEVARRLREEHQYRGYIHLKTIPECSEELIEQAGLYADRLSINVELPTETDLQKLAPEKRTPQIEAAMAEVKARRDASQADRRRGFRAPTFAPAGQSTQMIVGATPTPDREILIRSTNLYQRHDLRRVYYSAYSPIPHADARLPGQSPPLVREHRLYQADWLLRFYGFEADEIAPDDAPDLDLELDPKTAWALRHRELFPVDVNKAPQELLLRVPGLGVQNVQRLLKIRRFRALRLADLKRLRVPLTKARPFLLTADPGGGKYLDSERLRERFAPKPTQKLLFDAAGSALTGEV
ncbi:MAG: putative DNA modification/repair radical SAM protein, partial [Planctomycetota bacterium]